jgi:hypothetical protein
VAKIIDLNGATPAPSSGYTLGIWQEASSPSGIDSTTGEPIYPVSVQFKIPAPVQEVPAGTINGSNTVFTLTYTPSAGSLIFMVNGVAQNPFGSTRDFTISGATITMTTAPAGGATPDWLMATYAH